jgi:chromosome segregation ATPase
VRKIILAIFLISLAFSSALSISFKDVPENHWAYKAVIALSKLGIMSGYPDGTFRGNETVSRYQLAKTIYNLVIYVNGLLNKYRLSSNVEKRLSELADMASKAYKWSSENSAEISKLEKKLEDLSKAFEDGRRFEDIYNEIASLKNEMIGKLVALDKEYRSSIKGISNRIEELEIKFEDVKKSENSSIDEKFQSILGNMSEIEKRVEKVEKISEESSKAYMERVSNIEERLGELERDMRDFSNKQSRLEEEVSKVSKNVLKYIDTKMSNLENQMKSDLDSLESRLNKLQGSYEDLLHEKESFASSISYLSKNFDELNKRLSRVEQGIEKLQEENSHISEKIKDFEANFLSDLEDIRKKVDENARKIEFENERLSEEISNVKKYVDKRISESSDQTLLLVSLLISLTALGASVVAILTRF